MSTFRTLLVGAALAWTAAVHAFPAKPHCASWSAFLRVARWTSMPAC